MIPAGLHSLLRNTSDGPVKWFQEGRQDGQETRRTARTPAEAGYGYGRRSLADRFGGLSVAVSGPRRAGWLETRSFILLEHGFGACRINTCMSEDRSPSTPGLSTHFISLSFSPIPRQCPGEFSLGLIVARRVQHRAVEAYSDLLRRLLIRHGVEASLGRIDHDAGAGWRVHFHSTDPAAVVRFHEIAVDEGGPGDLMHFEADERIRHWLGRIESRITVAQAKVETRRTGRT
jgi:hypothetical protein